MEAASGVPTREASNKAAAPAEAKRSAADSRVKTVDPCPCGADCLRQSECDQACSDAMLRIAVSMAVGERAAPRCSAELATWRARDPCACEVEAFAKRFAEPSAPSSADNVLPSRLPRLVQLLQRVLFVPQPEIALAWAARAAMAPDDLLQLACHCGSLELAKFALHQGAARASGVLDDALVRAAMTSNAILVKMLLSRVTPTDGLLERALRAAVFYGQSVLVIDALLAEARDGHALARGAAAWACMVDGSALTRHMFPGFEPSVRCALVYPDDAAAAKALEVASQSELDQALTTLCCNGYCPRMWDLLRKGAMPHRNALGAAIEVADAETTRMLLRLGAGADAPCAMLNVAIVGALCARGLPTTQGMPLGDALTLALTDASKVEGGKSQAIDLEERLDVLRAVNDALGSRALAAAEVDAKLTGAQLSADNVRQYTCGQATREQMVGIAVFRLPPAPPRVWRARALLAARNNAWDICLIAASREGLLPMMDCAVQRGASDWHAALKAAAQADQLGAVETLLSHAAVLPIDTFVGAAPRIEAHIARLLARPHSAQDADGMPCSADSASAVSHWVTVDSGKRIRVVPLY